MQLRANPVCSEPVFLHLSPLQKGRPQQCTLAQPVQCIGVGVHSGLTASLKITPAPVNTGYVFIRTDLPASQREIPARWDAVVDTSMCTKIANAHGSTVSTVEHVLAALSGCGIHNAFLELDGPEVPIMDGSAAVFVKLLKSAGVCPQATPIRTVRLLKPVTVTLGKSTATLSPSLTPSFTMKFNANGRLNNQEWALSYYPAEDDFHALISQARTFGFYEDAERLWSAGLAKGASLENTIVIRDGAVMNENGLRHEDELIRHKILDAVGDFALAGVSLMAAYDGVNCGHAINNQLLRKLFSDHSAWMEDPSTQRTTAHRLPGQV